MNPPAESGSIGLKKDVVTTLSKGAYKMANAGMKKRFGAANPDYRSRIPYKRMHLFSGDGRRRAWMEDFRGVHTMKQRPRRRGIENLRDAGFC